MQKDGGRYGAASDAERAGPVEAVFGSGSPGLLLLTRQTARYITADGEREFRLAGPGESLSRGCLDRSGTFYVGVSARGRPAGTATVHCWRPDWSEWRVCHEFRPGYVGRLHSLQYDRYGDRIWVVTGDRDGESLIGWFGPGARLHTLTVIASSSQLARTRRLSFLPDRVLWGTHSYHLTPNRLFSWNRRTGSVELEGAVRGPVSDATTDEWGRWYISSSAESSDRAGVGQARILMSEQRRRWHEVARWLEADGLSGTEHAALRFPQHAASDGRLLVVAFGVQGGDGTWLLEA